MSGANAPFGNWPRPPAKSITINITAAEYIVLLAAIDNAADDVDALDLSFEGFNSLIAARLRRIAKTLRNI